MPDVPTPSSGEPVRSDPMVEHPLVVPDLTSPERFLNRELSWLSFGNRLLDLAADRRLPILERLRFLAIFSENIDEFFQVRVSALEDQVAAGLRTRSPDGRTPREQLGLISEAGQLLVGRLESVVASLLSGELPEVGLEVTDWSQLAGEDRDFLLRFFERRVFPILTPLAVDPGHPFPYISNLSLNLLVRVADPSSGEERIARVKVPPRLDRFVWLPDGRRLVAIEQVIGANLDHLFPSMVILDHHAFRVTRNSDLSLDDDDGSDPLAAIELELHRRRFGQAVRLEISTSMPDEMLGYLLETVEIPPANVFRHSIPLDLTGLEVILRVDRPELEATEWTPRTPPTLVRDRSIFDILNRHDVLVHHPYESFSGSVEEFLRQAANDPDVVAIKQTLYRTGEESPVVEALLRASRAGKSVTAVVELQARFDEEVNIAWSRVLEEHGVDVVYGLTTLKTHSKMSLVVRKEGENLRRYCHIGSGNYNASTALSYEDVGLLTGDPSVGRDVAQLFNLLAGSGEATEFSSLIVSPESTRDHVIGLIADQATLGSDGHVVLKVNGLTDPAVIDALYRASMAGATIELLVRGRCALRPQVPGLSENIRVRSIVGRFLEHSRIFRFGGREGPVHILLGSPDLMERNLDRRVEVLVPILDEAIATRLEGILEAALRDEANSWQLRADGGWDRLARDSRDHFEANGSAPSPGDWPAAMGFNVQGHFQELARPEERRTGAGRQPEQRSRTDAVHVDPVLWAPTASPTSPATGVQPSGPSSGSSSSPPSDPGPAGGAGEAPASVRSTSSPGPSSTRWWMRWRPRWRRSRR